MDGQIAAFFNQCADKTGIGLLDDFVIDSHLPVCSVFATGFLVRYGLKSTLDGTTCVLVVALAVLGLAG